MEHFEGKLAVVTGAGSGIGRALAVRCATEGMRVALVDLHAPRLQALREYLASTGCPVTVHELDVADPEAYTAFADALLADSATPALLFNNAGVLRAGETWSHSFSDWQSILSINVLGVVNGINAFVPAMLASQNPCHIINTGSVGSLVAAPGMAQYTAAKMALRGITECLALDLAAQNAPIDVSLLCPGPVMTAISDDLLGIEPSVDDMDTTNHMMADQPDFMTPQAVADNVFAAIRERRFWIFTHPFSAYLTEQNNAVVAGDYPSYSEVTFDANRD